jgi:alkylation response protein AidB-like acyl-CoA dehydrogenase
MGSYTAPLQDMTFLLFDVLKIQDLANELPAYADMSRDVVSPILEEAGKFCSTVLQPINGAGDAHGCKYENGAVTTPPGVKDAYAKFVEGGWPGFACDLDHGGQGLPTTIAFAFEEMISAANMSFSLYPLLTHGAYHALKSHASDELKNLYLPKMVAGTWTGTMNLTEPHCGTDLGLIKTKAEQQADGTYRISGTKIFITAGEHDVSENIIHLVLARVPGTGDGVRGLSLFVCPKFIPEKDGSLGPRNTLSCGSLESKMGIRASPTCVMNYDGATAWLVGTQGKGLAAMFTMMNRARLAVGVQGLGVAEAAYQGATNYARARLQMRSPTGAKFPQQAADPIIVHPDVRRTLMRMRAMTEGCRALALWTALQLDVSMFHSDADRRQEADDFVALLTPVVKATLSDQGYSAANDAIQIHGGHGYIRDWGMEQLARDARITQIYEGTNGIQAMDLAGRKRQMELGRLPQRFFDLVQSHIDQHTEHKSLPSALQRLRKATEWLNAVSANNPEETGAAASDYLRLFGLVAIGYMWSRMATTASTPDNPFHRAKRSMAEFYMQRILPETEGLLTSITAGSQTVMSLADVEF